jgi:hypothetical protein
LFSTDRLRTAQRALPQAEIDAAPDAMVRNRRAGELLSRIRVLEVRLPFDVATLLRKAFEAKDYHTFLKQAHRLRVRARFEKEIELAIHSSDERRQKQLRGAESLKLRRRRQQPLVVRIGVRGADDAFPVDHETGWAGAEPGWTTPAHCFPAPVPAVWQDRNNMLSFIRAVPRLRTA